MADADKLKAEKLKDEGNKELKVNNLVKAIELYTEAIILNPTNHVYYSNRSAAFAKDKKYEQALSDAQKCVELKPDWAKGYSRLGAALSFLHRYDEAEEVYRKGLKIEPNNAQLKQGLDEASSNNVGNPADNPFAVPDLLAQLHANPKTRAYLQQPDYLQMLELLKKNPRELGSRLQDPRIMETIGLLLGIPTAGAEEPSGPSPSEPPKTSKEPKAAEPEPMEEEPEPAIKQSLQEKEQGNAAYKKKDFETALQHYGKAIELDPKNMAFYTNRAAVYFEQGKYDDCIEECHKAVDIGRQHAAGYKAIAKALLRVGNAYYKQGNYEEAKRFYDKSLIEHRSPETLKKSQEVDKMLQEIKRKAYIDPEKAEEEKQKGNECFKSGDFPMAVKHYTEAIKRNPDDAKLYSNRAGCYHKLTAFNLGLEDCETCIRLDPSFVKGYTRKGGLLFALKKFSEAIETYQKALQLDQNNKEAMEGIRACQQAYANIPQDQEEIKKRAMADPEVQEILSDPGMKIILEQMQENPKAAKDHLSNPDILRKVQKLIDVGILQIR